MWLIIALPTRQRKESNFLSTRRKAPTWRKNDIEADAYTIVYNDKPPLSEA